MSTRSIIGIANPNGSITGIYCHHDGYLSHHAPILLNHYNTATKVRALMKLGGLSVLGEQLGEKHDLTDYSGHPLWCKSYSRDRDELESKSEVYADLKDFINEQHHYLFKDKQWWYVDSASLSLIDLRVALVTDRLID